MRAPRPPKITAFALAAAALALAGCSSGSKHAATTSATSSANANATAPACLPTTFDHSAKLPGLDVDVTPAPDTATGDPRTQISFLGAPASQIHSITVTATGSGSHTGHLQAYSQGDGASFVPDAPFKPGEQVTVHATITGKPVSFTFKIDTPWSTAGTGEFPNNTAAPSEYQTFETLPGVQVPTLTVTKADHDPSAGDIFTTNGPGPGPYGPLIYTPQGQLVWFHKLPSGIVADDLNVQTFDGQRDLTYWQGKVLNLGFGLGQNQILNSHYETVATVRAGNGLQADLHEFQIAPHDVAYVTAYNPIQCDLSSQQGPRNGVILDATLQEIDTKTGLVRWQWHSLDHFPTSDSETSPPDTRPWDWFHLNSIDPEPDGHVLISARSMWAVYQLEGGSGKVDWTLGGLKSSFQMGPGTKTAWQHDARMLSNGDVTIFDDGSIPVEEPQSRAIRIGLDLKTHEAKLLSAYKHPDPALSAASQGNMQTLADGNAVVGYGGVPWISEFAPDGSLLFDAHMSPDLIFYRAYRHPWSGRPQSPPVAIANLNNTAVQTIVQVSWNGATGVTAWRVLAGKTPGSLQPQTTVASTGFETQTIVPSAFVVSKAKTNGYVAVEALDSAGHVLGRSATVAVKPFAALFAPSAGS